MNVRKTIELEDGHKIEFGDATWDEDVKSVRNRYPTSTGGFSPRSSSEIPIGDITIIVTESIKHGYLSQNEILDIIETGIKKLREMNENKNYA